MVTGRPSDMTKIVGQAPLRDDDGTVVGHKDVTVTDRILELVRAGVYVETAAASAGISKQALYEWLRIGAHSHRKRAATAQLPAPDRFKPTAHEKRCMVFGDAIAEAVALSEADDVVRLARLAQGGQQIETTTVKTDAAGNVLERVTKTETLQPNASVVTWRLERRFPARYGRRGHVELTAPDGLPVLLDPEAIVAKLRAAQEAQAAELLEGVRDYDDVAVRDYVEGDVVANGNDEP